MPTPFDWTPIFGIEFRFTSAHNPTAAASLNKAYSEIIDKDELSELFVARDAKEDKGPLEIAPDPQLHILNYIAKTIAINLIDPDEVTKGHIANLLSKCVIKHVTNNGGPTKRMQYTAEFDAAAKYAIQTNTDEEPTVLIEITITHWRFKPNWNASLFNKVYEDQSVTIPSSPATIPSNTKTTSFQAHTICTPLAYKASSASGECLLPTNVLFPARPPLSDAHLHTDLVVSLTKRHHDALKIKLKSVLSIALVPNKVSDQQLILFPIGFVYLQLVPLIDGLQSPLAFLNQCYITSAAVLDLAILDLCLQSINPSIPYIPSLQLIPTVATTVDSQLRALISSSSICCLDSHELTHSQLFDQLMSTILVGSIYISPCAVSGPTTTSQRPIGFYGLFGFAASTPDDALSSGSGGVFHNDKLQIFFRFQSRDFYVSPYDPSIADSIDTMIIPSTDAPSIGHFVGPTTIFFPCIFDGLSVLTSHLQQPPFSGYFYRTSL
eukprot:jgi/Psemu1/37527/gm1.37527_g